MRRTRILLAACGVIGIGCAYYNGLYNANRLADDARRAEREGRTSEARSLWSRAAIKAESVATRFPGSKYRDDALLLQGTALSAIAACTRAVAPLEIAADSSPDPRIQREARLTLARCRLAMFEPDSVGRVLTPLIDGGDSLGRSEALLVRGRAALALADPRAAEQDLAASGHPAAAFPRAIALTQLGRTPAAVARLAARVPGEYDEGPWLAALDTVGREDPRGSADLVDRLAARHDLTTGQRARLYLADGERWQAAGDSARARARFAAAASEAPDSVSGRAARAHLGVAAIHAATAVDRVRPLVDTLRAATRRGGEPTRIGGRHMRVLDDVAAILETGGGGLPLFLAAETVRDSLRADLLAAALFEEVARLEPTSVLAPKALLAAAWLRPAVADSLVAIVRRRYPESVYVRALDGRGGDAFGAVEDSLQRAPEDTSRVPARDRGRNR